nr:MAG TPA: hypothetical protein [Caudoviricetes sp.]
MKATLEIFSIGVYNVETTDEIYLIGKVRAFSVGVYNLSLKSPSYTEYVVGGFSIGVYNNCIVIGEDKNSPLKITPSNQRKVKSLIF